MILSDGISQIANGKCRAGGLMGEKGVRHREGRLCAVVKKASIFLVAVVILIPFLTSCNNVKFKRYEAMNSAMHVPDIPEHSDVILVKNMPKSLLERSKIMIAYYDSAGLSWKDFTALYPDKVTYSIEFLKSTPATRRFYNKLERNRLKGLPPPRMRKLRDYEMRFRYGVYFGSVTMYPCRGEEDKSKHMIFNSVYTGVVSLDGWFQINSTALFIDCDNPRHLNRVDPDNELVKYFMELQSKRN